MVANFVNQDVAHQMLELFIGFEAMIEQRSAVEEDDIHIHRLIPNAFFVERQAVIQAQEVKWTLKFHLFTGLLIGKVDDSNSNSLHMFPQ